jgi:hypothetical protein
LAAGNFGAGAALTALAITQAWSATALNAAALSTTGTRNVRKSETWSHFIEVLLYFEQSQRVLIPDSRRTPAPRSYFLLDALGAPG